MICRFVKIGKSRSRAYLFARHGIAALIYDRRGKGASKGGGENANWVNLAEDALAGLRYPQSRAEVNPQLVGVSGFSQGGWVSPLAATRASAVAFVLVGSTPGVTPDAQNDYNVESLLRSQQLAAETLAAVLSLRQRVSQYQHTGKGDVAAEIRRIGTGNEALVEITLRGGRKLKGHVIGQRPKKSGKTTFP